MAIWMAGIDHTKADLDVRSRFSFTSKRMALAYEAFLNNDAIDGCVMISTCNRMELWLSVNDNADFSPVRLLCSYLEEEEKEYRDYFMEREGKEAVEHLFRLAAGLESKIVGEDQILTQVGNAVAFARSCYAADNTLEVLFRLAVTAGKRVRTETDLSTADRSVIHTAIRKLEEEGITIAGKKCMVIGNGMMGKLSAQTLMESGADVTVTVRKYHSGVVDIPPGCKRIIYDERYELFPSCDLVVSATSSPNYTLTADRLSQLSIDHKIPLIDLAVPRDIEPEIKDCPWAVLYDIDSFAIDLKTEKFQKNLEKAERILKEEMDHFYDWYEGRDFIPVIQSLKKQAGCDVSARMTPVFKQIPLEPEGKKKLIHEVESASERMMNHLLFSMRTKLSDRTFREFLDAMQTVFGKE